MQREEEPEGATEEGTVEKSLKRKEAAIRYRLQMAPFTWAVAGETVGAGIVEWLRGIAATADLCCLTREVIVKGWCMRCVRHTHDR